MNKYQEAKAWIDKINDHAEWTRCDIEEPALSQLKELVKRATPKKPIDRTKYEEHSNDFFENYGGTLKDIRCPNCNKKVRLVHKYKYCAKCGQALDWSDEE